MVIQYQITDLYKYAYKYANAEKLLEGIASRELIKYLVNVNLDRVMAEDRHKAATFLKSAIAEQADAAELGVEMKFVGFRGIHPPAEVAKEFEEVATSMSKKEIEILKAEKEANVTLTNVAGSRELAQRLYAAIEVLEPRSGSAAPEAGAVASAHDTLDRLISTTQGRIGGDAAKIINTAKARAYRMVMTARADREGIDLETASYQAAPDYYRRRRRLEVLAEAIRDKPKLVISFVPKDGAIIKVPGQNQEFIDIKPFREKK